MFTFYIIWIIRIRLKGKRYPTQSKSKKIQISLRIWLQNPDLVNHWWGWLQFFFLSGNPDVMLHYSDGGMRVYGWAFAITAMLIWFVQFKSTVANWDYICVALAVLAKSSNIVNSSRPFLWYCVPDQADYLLVGGVACVFVCGNRTVTC